MTFWTPTSEGGEPIMSGGIETCGYLVKYGGLQGKIAQLPLIFHRINVTLPSISSYTTSQSREIEERWRYNENPTINFL